MKTDFHLKEWALRLALKRRPGVTRKWIILSQLGIMHWSMETPYAEINFLEHLSSLVLCFVYVTN